MAGTFHGRKCTSLLAVSGERDDAFALYVVDDGGGAWRVALDDARTWQMSRVEVTSVPSPSAAGCVDLSIGDTGIAGDVPIHPRGRLLRSFASTTSPHGPAGTVSFEDGSSMTVKLVFGDRVALAWDWGGDAER